MATDYQDIIDAIDAAILVWAGQPVEIDNNCKKTVYRTLNDLIRARQYYVQLQASAALGGNSMQFAQIEKGGPRG